MRIVRTCVGGQHEWCQTVRIEQVDRQIGVQMQQFGPVGVVGVEEESDQVDIDATSGGAHYMKHGVSRG